jgi:hypothetical protein
VELNDLTVVVCCNKKDAFLAKICIASIRYYYPAIPIELIKDPGNGIFNTKELEKYLKVQLVDLGIKKMGWSGAKFHYLYQQQKGKKVLMLDADIVFIGPFLERLLPSISSNDYVISIDENDLSNIQWINNTYFDIDAIQNAYPSYKYPGYFFNAGQIFVTVGAIDLTILNRFFNAEKYPFWLNKKLFPLVDQSVYNYLLPSLEAARQLKLGKEKFMIWSKHIQSINISLNDIVSKRNNAGLVHWAGSIRLPYVPKMEGGKILNFFEDFYYQQIPFGYFKKSKIRTIGYLDFLIRKLYRSSVKKVFNLNPHS